MTSAIYQQFLEKSALGQKQLAVLIDPDDCDRPHLQSLIALAQQAQIDYIFVGGTHITNDQLSEIIQELKSKTNIPVIIFPGGTLQIDHNADAFLLLSLLSGRNAEYLIGKHVEAAPLIKKSKLECISTGYILIDGGKSTAVNYITQTIPIPQDKLTIAASTALAGQLLGMKTIYLEAGSGAEQSISSPMIQTVKKAIEIPLLVGGGIRTSQDAERVWQAGADIVVVGNAIEKRVDFITTLTANKTKLNTNE